MRKVGLIAAVLGTAAVTAAAMPQAAQAHKCDRGDLVVDRGCSKTYDSSEGICDVWVSVAMQPGVCVELPSA